MKKQKLFQQKVFGFGLMMVMFLFVVLGSALPFSCTKKATTSASETILPYSTETDIYIYNPTYSTIYNGKIYFVDEYDYMLKICTLKDRTYETPVSLEKYEGYKINCAESLDSYLFLVFSNEETNKLVSIDLSEDIPAVYETNLEESYNQISASKKAENKFYLVLMPTEDTSSPAIVVLDYTSAKVTSSPTEKKFTLNIKYNEIKNANLFKILIQPQNESQNATLIFIYDKNVGFFTVENFDSNGGGEIEVPETPTFTPQPISEFEEKQIEYVNVNTLYLSEKPYLLISYKETINIEGDSNTQTKLYSNIYNYEFPKSDNKWQYKGQVEINSNVLTNQNNIIFSEGQTIIYKTVSAENFGVSGGESITNPDITILPDLNNLKYYHTTTETALLTSPWNYSSPLYEIPTNTDVICIATASVPQAEITDYLYCLLTIHENGTDRNITGFINKTHLEQKSEVGLDKYGHVEGIDYPRISVIPKNTRLYTHPTSVEGDVVDVNGETLFTNSYTTIPENSKIEVVDVICEYTESNNTSDILLKVRVNHDMNHEGLVGYITDASILKNTDCVEFLIPNATISADAYVYQDKDASSTIIDVLKSGKAIKILEGRNSRDGYTYIAYNDAFGNECYGYVKNDFIVTDNWTTMQIIGCVLIAVNLGLLVLILIFKYKNLGPHGENYNGNKKENAKKQA